MAALCRWIAVDFRLKNVIFFSPLPTVLWIPTFKRLAGVPFPIACAALPSPSSSIIYGAIARMCPEIHTRQTFCSHTDLSELLTSLSPVSPLLLTPLSLPRCYANPCASLGCRSAGVMRMPVAVQNSWSRYGRRSFEWHRQAQPHRIDFTSHILLCPNHHWLRFKYVSPYVLLIRKDSQGTIFNSVQY